MNYTLHSDQQGSDEWLAGRNTRLNASELVLAAGQSMNGRTRTDLIRKLATGIEPEVDEHTQKRFSKGHRFEALARPIMEQIIGRELYPITASIEVDGLTRRLGASLDGATDDDSENAEHKSMNAALRDALAQGIIPIEYHWQMEQGQMVNGATRTLFMASEWDDDNLIEEMHVWYESNPELRAKIIPIWKQIEADAEAYVHVEHAAKPEATPAIGLPALFAQVEGRFNLATNIDLFSRELKQFVGKMDLSPTDDQGFADLEAQVKVCAQAEESIKAQVLGARGQMVSFDEFCKTAELLLAIAARARIDGTNAIKDKKVAIKAKAIADAKVLFAAHVAGLEVEIAPIRLIVEQPDFIDATRSLKGLKSLHNAIDAALANGKIAADAAAKDMRTKRMWFSGEFDEYEFLFRDMQSLVTKPIDDYKLAITSRIDSHKAAEAAKEEAQRVAIQAAATAKAEREAAEKLAEAEAKLRAAQAEEDALVDSIWKQARRVEGDSVQYVNKAIVQFETVAKAWESDPRPRVASAIADARQQLAEKLRAADERAKAEQDAARIAVVKELERTDALDRAVEKEQAEAATIEERRKQAQLDAQAQPFKLSGAKTVVAQSITSRRPNRAELLDAIATTFGTTNEAALDWILQEFRADIKFAAKVAA